MKITAQDKIAVIFNLIPPKAEKQVLGFKVSDLQYAKNLSMKPPAVVYGVSLGNGKYCTLRLKIDHQTPKDLGKILQG